MYVDDLLLICDHQEMIGDTATDYSEATINLSGVVGDPGSGAPLYMIICVTVGFTATLSTGTVTFAVVEDPDVDVCDQYSVVIVQTAPIVVGSLPIGTVLCIPLPAGLITEQYIGLKCTYATSEVLTGRIDAFIGLHPVLNP